MMSRMVIQVMKCVMELDGAIQMGNTYEVHACIVDEQDGDSGDEVRDGVRMAALGGKGVAADNRACVNVYKDRCRFGLGL